MRGSTASPPAARLPRPDLLIVARGGGSIEDLWGFNEEIVARAAAASDIPLISAVGHETDTTLIDYVADMRAPTPTAAAELAVPVRLELLAWVDAQDARLTRGITQAVGQRRQRLGDLSRALPKPTTLVATAAQRLDVWAERLPKALIAAAQRKRLRLADAAGLLRPATLARALRDRRQWLGQTAGRLAPGLSRVSRERRRDLDRQVARLRIGALQRDVQRKAQEFDRLSQRLSAAGTGQIDGWARRLDAMERLRQTLGYRETLKRGYAVVRAEGAVITTKAKAETAMGLEIEFSDGRLAIGGKSPKKQGQKPKPPSQGSLF